MIMQFLAIVFTVLKCIQAATVTVNWRITYVENVNPDGQFPRRAIGINGTWPPPPIVSNLGDVVVIHVKNDLDVKSGLHTHGLFHNGTNHFDGAVGITECGIAPGSTFTYNLTMRQSGTFWIHGHLNGQYVDGLQSAFIVKDEQDKLVYKYDNEYVIALTDWYHEQHSVMLEHFLSIYNPMGAEPIPDTAIINHGEKTELKFEPKKSYRIRIISMTAIGLFNVYLTGHKFKVIEVDGVLVEPFETDSLHLSAAQRYSILVTALDKADTNFKFHAKMDQNMLDSPSPNPNASIPIIYSSEFQDYEQLNGESDYPSDPTLFDQLSLVPFIPQENVAADRTILLNVDFVQFQDAFNHGTFNRTIFQQPIVPPIFTAMTMAEKAMDSAVYGPRTLASVLKHMDMVQLVINNLDGGHHPFHLHGHNFQVVQLGTGVYDESVHGADNMKLKNPIRRDVVIIPGEGFVVLKFRADNPGVWLFHCHIEFHMQAGLATFFVEAPDVMQQRLRLPESVFEQCRNLNMKTSGNAAGFNDTVNFLGIEPNLDIYPEHIQVKGVVSLSAMVVSALIGLGAVVWYSAADFNEI